MTAPDSLKLKIGELLDAHWEEILREQEFYDVVYDDGYYFPIKIQVGSDGKYISIRLLPKLGAVTL